MFRAIVAVDGHDEEAVAHSRDCLSRVPHRPNDADAHSLLAAILLTFDPVRRPPGLRIMLCCSRCAVTQAPDLDRAPTHDERTVSDRQYRCRDPGRRARPRLNPDNAMTTGSRRILFVTGRWDEGRSLREPRAAGRRQQGCRTTLALDAYRRGAFDETFGCSTRSTGPTAIASRCSKLHARAARSI